MDGIAIVGKLSEHEVARAQTRAAEMTMRCEDENERKLFAFYLGGGLLNLPLGASAQFYDDGSCVIYPRGLANDRVLDITRESRFIFDGHGERESDPATFSYSSEFLTLPEHFHWVELDEKNPVTHCSYENAE